MLDKKTLEELKSALLVERQEVEKLLGAVGEKDEKTNEWKPKFPNLSENADESLEDAADEVEEFNNNTAVEETLKTRLQNINHALEKMKNGIYGKCEECDKEIPVERLKAYPATRYCPECEEK